MELGTLEKFLTASVMVFYLLSLAFDATVTYTVYSTHSEYFFVSEKNKEIVRFIKFRTVPWTMIGWFCLALLPLMFYCLERIFKKEIFHYLLILSVFMTLFIAYMHLKGGLSWWKL